LTATASLALLLAAVALLAAGLTWLVVRKRAFVDIPNDRSSHATPTPRGGGIGIVAAAGLGACVWLLMPLGSDIAPSALAGLFAGAIIVAAAGLIDDMRRVSAVFKFAGQAAASAIAVALGVSFERAYLPGFGTVALGVLGPIATFLWLVAMTNAYNFMDGLDGIAGGVAIIAAAFLAAVAIAVAAGTVAGLAAILAAASLGFLVFNLPPARVFMGDVGSQFLGFAFAALAVFLARSDASGGLVYAVPILLIHFIFDTAFTFFRRLAGGENVVSAHRSHLYQRLNRSGLGHGRVAATLCGFTAMQGLVALWAANRPASSWPLALLAVLAIQAGYATWVARRAGGGAG
jgi:UDP-GlcNAc:undecaprenyl-phosphate GlcNAc-1-phosphate transferase